jgi:TetR/AcrR family transcriptional regulator, transcriptional repressor for nem operon
VGRVTDAKDRLLQTTLSLIRRDGYGAVSVDAICEKAGVKKGSFYYFFPSKDDLVVAALDAHWEFLSGRLERIFSPDRPPDERLAAYFEFIEQRQRELKRELGRVVGCPLFSIGSEVSAHNPAIVAKVQQIVGRILRYFETALRDLHAQGFIPRTDFMAKARALQAYYQGVLTQARIHDDLALTKDIAADAFRLIGLPAPRKASPARKAAAS